MFLVRLARYHLPWRYQRVVGATDQPGLTSEVIGPPRHRIRDFVGCRVNALQAACADLCQIQWPAFYRQAGLYQAVEYLCCQERRKAYAIRFATRVDGGSRLAYAVLQVGYELIGEQIPQRIVTGREDGQILKIIVRRRSHWPSLREPRQSKRLVDLCFRGHRHPVVAHILAQRGPHSR